MTPAAKRREELEAELTRVLPIIVEHYQPEKIILYGSLARGTVGEGSDIDLCIVKRTAQPRHERAFEVRQLIDERKATDIVVYTPEEADVLRRRRPSFFAEEVERRGRVLYERP